MIDTWQPELARIHMRLDRVLLWSGVLFLASCLLPIGVEWESTLWSWTVLDSWRDAPGVTAPFVAGLVLVGLSQWRASSLIKALAAGLVVLIASYCIAANADTGEALLYGLPPQMRTRGWLLAIALISAGLASRWIGGPRQGQRAVKPAHILLAMSGVAMLALLLWPVRGRPLIVTLGLSAWQVVANDSWGVSRSSLAVNFMLSAMPITIAAFIALLALMWPISRAAWVVAIPPAIIVMWSMKVATQFGSDVSFGIGLRAAIIFAAQLMIGVFASEAALSQLLDAHVPEVLARTGLLRDVLLAQALARGTTPKHAADGYRPWLKRLVRERYESLALAESLPREKNGSDPRVRLRLTGLPHDDIARLNLDEVHQRIEGVRLPEISRWASALAEGRRIEIAAAGALTLGLAAIGATHWIGRSQPPQWDLQPAPAWATGVFQQLLPDVAIAAGESKEELAKAVEETAKAAAPAPAVADSIRALLPLAAAPGANIRAIVQAGERLNEAAREAHLPFHVDPNVLTYFHADGRRTYVFYVKTYAIKQVREAVANGQRYQALYLERLDATNVVEHRLGWRKHGAPYATVILDVIADHWNEQKSELASQKADALREEWAKALATDGMPLDHARLMLDRAIAIPELQLNAELADDEDDDDSDDDSQAPEEYVEAARELDPVAIHALARMVEGHELQHQIDADTIRPPDAIWRAMAGYDDATIMLAASELSAYLAEIVRAPRPKLALIHFQSVANAGSPELFAWTVAGPLLTQGKDVDDILDHGDSEEIRRRAQDAHRALFGEPVPELRFQ